MKRNITLLTVLCLAFLMSANAQPTDDYVKAMNSYVPGSPQAAQLMKYVDYPVSLFTGTPQISIPIYNLTGIGISVPVSLSYHAGGGVKVDEVASSVGLGWALEAGGEITREIRGSADEGGSGIGYFSRPKNMRQYIADYYADMGNYTNFGQWVSAFAGTLDLEPDIFYFSFSGASGKFAYDDSLQQFVCLTETSHLNITRDATSNAWKIITDDGTSYIFDLTERSNSQTLSYGVGYSAWGPIQTTSWKLTKVINADKTDSITLEYAFNEYLYWSEGSNIAYKRIQGVGTNNVRPPLNSYSYNDLQGRALTKIKGRNFSVNFIDDVPNRSDLPPGNKALGKITITNKDDEVQDIFVLHHGYFGREYSPGIYPAAGYDLTMKSLRLDSVSEYGNSESNPDPIRHAFKYNSTTLPARLSYGKDFWGYPNYNDFTETLAPGGITSSGWSIDNYDGADRFTDPTRLSAGILEQIRLPTGGKVQFEYEPNTTAVPVSQAKPPDDQLLSVSHGVNEWDSTHSFQHEYSDTFVINVGPDYAINNNYGGVIANIYIAPITPPGNDPLNPLIYPVAGHPYFYVRKIKEADGSPLGGTLGHFEQTLFLGGKLDIYMPDGIYVVTAYENGMNQNDTLWPPTGEGAPSGTGLSCLVSYHIPDTSTAVVNYELAGLRVKSITTTDQYSNISNVRTFHYHDPVTDSSYGSYIGSTLSSFIETSSYDGLTQWLVRMGSYNMPGMAGNSCNVVYPKVFEDVTENGVTYRVEHNYDVKALPQFGLVWPFVPVIDKDHARGNEYLTTYDRYTTTGFLPAKEEKKIYDYGSLALGIPVLQPYTYVPGVIYGIKCTAASYDMVGAGQYAPTQVMPYPVYTANRAYLTSDSTITYDLNNTANKVTEWHDYTYGAYNLMPLVMRTGNSDGSVGIKKNWYASDQPEANSNVPTSAVSQMILSNRVSQPLGSKEYKDNQLLSQQYTYPRFIGDKLIIDSMRKALFSNSLETEIKVLEYNANANPLTIEMRGGKFRKYIWQADRNLPLATAVMPSNSYFYFSSFEYDGTTGTAFSGSKAYQLPFNMITSTTFGESDVYLWATSSSFTVNSVAPVSCGKTKGIWTLYRAHLSGGTSISVTSGTSVRIDQLVLLPTGSQFQGIVYDNSNRIIAVVNGQMMTAFFEYDNYGRLEVVRDEQGNILKTSDYQYLGLQ